MTRLAPKFTVVRRVLSLSGNQCAFSDCNNPLVFEGAFVGELAHIYAAEAGGPRANTSMDDEQLRDFPNLMYLCGYHHTIIDKKELLDKYPAEMLIEMKRNHEARNTDQPFDATDEVLEQALEQINIVQANVLMNGNQTNIQQNFISQSASDASNALSQVIASTQAGEGEVTEHRSRHAGRVHIGLSGTPGSAWLFFPEQPRVCGGACATGCQPRSALRFRRNRG
jgi:hypothetical protein